MKTALTLLVVALFLMTIPLSADAYGGDRNNGDEKHYQGQTRDRHDGGVKHYQGQVKKQRVSDRYRQGRDHRWARQVKKQHKRQLHKPRRNNRYVVHQYNPRPYYAGPAAHLSFPRIVFHLGW